MQYIALYPGSALLYTCLLLMAIIMSWLAQKFKSKIPVWLIIIVLTIVAGARDYTVGNDTQTYIDIVNMASLRVDLEWGFNLITNLARLINAERLVLIIPAFFIYYFFFMGMWNKRQKVSMPLSVAIFMCFFYFETFNIIRQMLAMSIIFYSLKWIEEHNYKKFLIAVLVASAFHLTALSSLLIIYFDTVTWKQMPNRITKIAKLYFVSVPILLVVGYLALNYSGLIYTIQRKFNYFFKSGMNTIDDFTPGLMIYVKLLLLLVIIITFCYKQKSDINLKFMKQEVWLSWIVVFVGTLISYIGYKYQNMDRIAFYFTMIQIPLYSFAIKRLKSLIIDGVITLICIYTFLLYIDQGISACMPYFN